MENNIEKDMEKNEQKLLDILEKYCKRCNDFNIFKVLKMQSGSENRHSNFIAWLLDSKGSHNLGKKFFNKFFNSLNITDLVNIDCEIYREESCDVGRPDILIKYKEKVVCVIEVKFGAEETKNQLKDYYGEYSKQKCENFVLLDLDSTNYDKACKKYERDEEFKFSEQYKLATFKNNILPILEEELTLKDISSNGIIIDTLKQYIYLLEEKYEMYGKISIFDTVLKLQCLNKDKNVNEIFNKNNYYEKTVNDYLYCRQYRIIELLYEVVKSIENAVIIKRYNNSLSISFKYKNKNIELSNLRTKNNSEIKILINGQKPDSPLLFNEDEYNDMLFYVYEDNAETTIKDNLREKLFSRLEIKNI